MIKEQSIRYLKQLSGAQLDDFCTYWNSGPIQDGKKGKIKIEGDKDYQKGYLKRHLLSDQWSLYDHRYDNILWLCDEDGNIRLKGDTKQIKGLLLNIVRTDDALNRIPEREYGLVLSGGGAKGAFEIGVWRWLERSGLINKISGISGTSVGALNSVLFSCSTLEEAELIWRSIRQDDLTHLNIETLKRMAEMIFKTIVSTLMIKHVSPAMILKDLLPLAGESVFTQEKLSAIIDQVLKKRLKSEKIVFSCLARKSLQVQTDPPSDMVLGTFHNADYYCLNSRTNNEINKIVRASAALPGVYDPVEINRFQYRDGGCRDNTPYMPLVKAGFKKIIVVHISKRKYSDPYINMVEKSILFHVYPTMNTKQVIDTIRISEETTDNWINNGEQAATSQLGRFMKNGELVLPKNIKDYMEKERKVETFDFEHFNYDEVFEKVQSEVKKPNILICGATGVGKSTMIRDLFKMDEEEGPEIGNKGRSRTTGIHAYSPEGATITLYDSQGYNIGEDEKKYVNDVLGVIGEKFKKAPEEMKDHIHEVWYCVSAANNRFFSADEKMITEIRKKYAVPVMIILTKVDCVDEESIGHMKSAINDKVPDIEIYTYASDERTAGWNEEVKKQYVQTEEIMEWAVSNLDESLRAGFIPAMKKSLELKRKYISAQVVPKYTGFAAAAVLATSFINVPFTDSVPLMAIQVSMSTEIVSRYGIQADGQKLAADILGTSAVTVLGRTLAGSLIKVIPLAGNIFNATVNTSVAASVTALLGFAVALVCEQYLVACIDKNGAENIPFVQYMTPERLAAAFAYVKKNSSEFNVPTIVKDAVKTADNSK